MAIYNIQYVSRRVSNRRCVFSQCTPDNGDVERQFKGAIHGIAREFQRQIEATSRMAGVLVNLAQDVVIAVVAFIVAIILAPVTGGQLA